MYFSADFFDGGIYRRGTRCEKWDGISHDTEREMLPMWVADMDFPSPPVVQEAILRRAAHNAFGYTEVLADDFSAQADFWKRRHGVSFTEEEMGMLPCVVTGMKVAINALTSPGDAVVVQPPVYGPFYNSVEENGRIVVKSPLKRGIDSHYVMDYDDLETKFRQGARLMLLCNPHNPVGRVWRTEELARLFLLLEKYSVTLVSDEIHGDFVFAPGRFVSVLDAAFTYKRVISIASASKTFNLAGLQQAAYICRDGEIRGLLEKTIAAQGIQRGNIFALEATRAAYCHGDDWLDALLAYLEAGRDLFFGLMKAQLRKAELTPMEGTYLCWVDMRAYGMSSEELMRRTQAEGLRVTDGTFFGKEAGEGFIRVNLGCPHRNIEEAVKRLAAAVEV